MDAEQTRTLLAMAGFHLAPQAAQLEEREDRWAALLRGQWMAWFPMNADGLQRLATERRALRLLQACCSFHVPRVLFVAEAGWEIRTVLGASPSQGRGRGGPARARPIARDCPHVWGDPATSFPPTETEAQNSLNQLAEHPHAWAIEHDGRFLGVVGLDAVNLHDRPATLAIDLSNPAKLGMGLGREAIPPGAAPRIRHPRPAPRRATRHRLQ